MHVVRRQRGHRGRRVRGRVGALRGGDDHRLVQEPLELAGAVGQRQGRGGEGGREAHRRERPLAKTEASAHSITIAILRTSDERRTPWLRHEGRLTTSFGLLATRSKPSTAPL